MFDEKPTPLQAPEDVLAGLRWYQRDAHAAVLKAFETHQSVLVDLATGLGKTQLFSAIAKTWPGRVLVLAHRDELVQQARMRLEKMTGELVEVEQADLKSNRARIVVGSVQTVYRAERLERLVKLGGFSLVIPDEAHHYVSETYRIPLSAFEGAKVLGVTATPDRSDGRALGQVFESVAYSMGLAEGIEHGYLVPVRGREVEVKEIDLRKVASSGDDLNQEQLDEMMVEANEGVVQGMLHHSGERQGIVFFPGVASAELAAARMNAIKEGCAMSVSGETPKEERAAIMDAFRRGKFQFLTNCMVATEGFDAPTASVVGIARATKSRSLYAQMTGRGTRVLPGVVDAIEGRDNAPARRDAIKASDKPSCLLIDFVGNSGRHVLVNPMDLLGGNYDEPTKKRAKEIAAESDGEVDIQAALEQAKEDLVRRDLDRKALERAAKTFEARVTATSRTFDPFKHLGVDMEREDKFNVEFGFKPMSEKQHAFLAQRGFSGEELKGVSRRAATRLINATIDRSKKGLAGKPQADLLARNGIVDKNITTQAANQVISYIRQQRRAGLVADQAIINLLTSNEEF